MTYSPSANRVRCVLEGLNNQEIGYRMNLTQHMVRSYVARIFDKFGVSTRLGLCQLIR
jgi:DNA-binding CsgD family transcriptional regulator